MAPAEAPPGALRKWWRSLIDVKREGAARAVPEGYQVDVERITEQKRTWIDQHADQGPLSRWPDHLFENFAIVGLAPDLEITQIAEDLCEKEYRLREAAPYDVGHAKVHDPPGSSSAGSQSRMYSTAPWPAYDPKVLYNYRSSNGLDLNDKDLAGLCFPYKVSPRKLKRSPSWSALNEIIFEKQYSRDDQSFIFMLKAAGASIPLYGVCCYVQEVLHRPPLLASSNFPACKGPYRQCLIAAPRCYCLVSRYPFFSLHFQVIGHILGIERLHRTVEFTKELSEMTEVPQNGQQQQPAAPLQTAGSGQLPPTGRTTGIPASQGSAFSATENVSPEVHSPPVPLRAAPFIEPLQPQLSLPQPMTILEALPSYSDPEASELRVYDAARGLHVQVEEDEVSSGSAGFTGQDQGWIHGPQDLGWVHGPGPRLGARMYSDAQAQSLQAKKAFKRASMRAISLASAATGAREREHSGGTGPGSNVATPKKQLSPADSGQITSVPVGSGPGSLLLSLDTGSSPPRSPQGTDACLPFLPRVSMPEGAPHQAPATRQPVMPAAYYRASAPAASLIDAGPGQRRPEGGGTLGRGPAVSLPPPAAQLEGVLEEASEGSVSTAVSIALSTAVTTGRDSTSCALIRASQAASATTAGSLASPTFLGDSQSFYSPEDSDESIPGRTLPLGSSSRLAAAGSGGSLPRSRISLPSLANPDAEQPKESCHGSPAAPAAPNDANATSLPVSLVESPSPAPVGASSEPTPQALADGIPRFHPKAILDQVYSAEALNPGDQLQLDLADLGSISFVRPQMGIRFAVVGNTRQILGYAEAELAFSLNNWAIAAAARHLSLDNLLTMLTAALLERQLVVFCPDISACSAIVLSLVPMLRPFSWQCLMMPVTPSSMIPLLDAPVPFILGLQYKTQEVMARCADLVRVNVYKDQVSHLAGMPALPGQKKLRAQLLPHYNRLREAAPAAAHRPNHVISEAEKQSARQFAQLLRNHLTTMMGDVRPHVITNVSLGKKAGILMKGSLIESAPARERPFIKIFLETQLFAVWCDHVIGSQVEAR